MNEVSSVNKRKLHEIYSDIIKTTYFNYFAIAHERQMNHQPGILPRKLQ